MAVQNPGFHHYGITTLQHAVALRHRSSYIAVRSLWRLQSQAQAPGIPISREHQYGTLNYHPNSSPLHVAPLPGSFPIPLTKRHSLSPYSLILNLATWLASASGILGDITQAEGKACVCPSSAFTTESTSPGYLFPCQPLLRIKKHGAGLHEGLSPARPTAQSWFAWPNQPTFSWPIDVWEINVHFGRTLKCCDCLLCIIIAKIANWYKQLFIFYFTSLPKNYVIKVPL